MSFSQYECAGIPVEQNCCVDIIVRETVGHVIRVIFMHRAKTGAIKHYPVDINAQELTHAQIAVHPVLRPVFMNAHMVNVEPLASFHVSIVIVHVDGGAGT